MISTHVCAHCGRPFVGRPQAKTCSAACRKAISRRNQAQTQAQAQASEADIAAEVDALRQHWNVTRPTHEYDPFRALLHSSLMCAYHYINTPQWYNPAFAKLHLSEARAIIAAHQAIPDDVYQRLCHDMRQKKVHVYYQSVAYRQLLRRYAMESRT